jgi:D-3-phosphoglycerate dehydrogenase
MTPRILVADPLSESGVAILRAGGRHDVSVQDTISSSALLESIGDYHAVVVRSRTKVTAAVIARGERLRVIGRSGVGLDNIDLAAAERRGVRVVYAPGASAISVAELTLGLLLCLLRRIPDADRSTRAGGWERTRFVGREAFGMTLGIIGFGNIGVEVARRAAPWGLRVLFADPLRARPIPPGVAAEEVSLDDLLAAADVVTLHVPLRPETRNLLDGCALSRMRAGAYLINTARGGLVDEAALLAALRSRRIAGAALDVFETEPPAGSPLLGEPNVIAVPHIGASTREAQERVSCDVARQVVLALDTPTP